MSAALPPRVAFWSLLPLILPQAYWVKWRSLSLPGAAGPSEGLVGEGEGEPFRFLALGDSVIAGVGAARLADALPGAAAAHLAQRLRRPVAWRALGRIGANAAQIRRELLPQLAGEGFDAALISVGVNDVTSLTPSRRYRRELGALLDALRAQAPAAVILLAGLPPLHGFPLLPQPLRWHMGLRGRSLDAFGQQVTGPRAGVRFAPLDFDPEPQHFAPDGYHPGPETHREFGRLLAEEILAGLPQPPPA
jgi:lysophospholipase L1-like esterase